MDQSCQKWIKLVKIGSNLLKLVKSVQIESNWFCKSKDILTSNLVQAAFVGKPGSDLASNLGITPQDDVLYAVFSESDSSEGEITFKPNKNSALCVYSLKKIRRKFMQNIQRCFTGM